MINEVVSFIIVPLLAMIYIEVRLDSAWRSGMTYGWKKSEELINLKIRQDGYILDGKRVRKTVDESDDSNA